MADDAFCYLMIRNIPTSFRTPDLRSFFSSALEDQAFFCFHYRHRPENKKLKNRQDIKIISDDAADCCPESTCTCLIKVPPEAIPSIRTYQHRKWRERNGSKLDTRCIICRVTLAEDGLQLHQLKNSDAEMDDSKNLGLTLTVLSHFLEFNPPDIMPQGNVGTKMETFLELIRTCRLPSSVIKKLELDFPVNSARRIYSRVPYIYEGTSVCNIKPHSRRVTDLKKIAKNYRLRNDENIDQQNHEMSEESDDCEDWERHESLHNDVTTQERTKERLYEDEVELPWEKGGSGLVYYTDAQFWDYQDGDFDEKTADDWDIDMFIYESQHGGDKDSRDFFKILHERNLYHGVYKSIPPYDEDQIQHSQLSSKSAIHRKFTRRRNANKTTKSFSSKIVPEIGRFEQYSKGIGRKIMTKYGWKTGEGLGSSTIGIVEALENEGQKPYDKKGLGYHGEKLIRFHQPSRRQEEWNDGVTITTVYDKLEDNC